MTAPLVEPRPLAARHWSLLPLRHILGGRLGLLPPREIESMAERSWDIAPAETSTPGPAYFLDGQLERVTGWAFANQHPGLEMQGGQTVGHAATRGFLLRDVLLLDGVLYKGAACVHLQPRRHRIPKLRVEHEVQHAAVFCSPGGNRYFGQWLMDDCVTYPMAEAAGLPVTTDQPPYPHTLAYEARLGMRPRRLHAAYLREAVVFQDFGQNRDKHRRFRAMTDKLFAPLAAEPHPGVFIVRGRTGDPRVLRNEMELAERLHTRRGFRVLDAIRTDVATILSVCAGARTVVGVEGSQLIHGILALPMGGSLLTLQPPNRFVSVYKHLTDRDHQRFGFVVGIPDGESFRIDPNELERTLDLMG